MSVIELNINQQAENGTLFKPFSLDTLIKEETGKRIDDEKWLANGMRQKTIDEVSERTADILEANGFQARLNNDIFMMGLVTSEVVNVIKYRNINAIMSVAQYNRREQSNTLRYMLKQKKYRHCRYLVASAGKRIPAHSPDFRQQIQKFSNKIRRFAYQCENKWDVEVICRIFEMPRDKNATYHLHANIVYKPKYKFSNRKWLVFLKWVRKFFGHGSKDCGVIKNVDEIVKYMIKGDDIDDIIADDESELLWLAQQTFNLRIFSSFYSFKDFRRDLKEQKKKVIIRKGQPVISNKSSTFKCNSSKYEIYIDEDGNEVKVLKEKPDDETTGVKYNEALTIATPYYFRSPYKEPVAVIRNFKKYKNGKLLDSYIDLEADLKEWREKAQEAWKANDAPKDINEVIDYSNMLRMAVDVDTVELLSRHRKEVNERAKEVALLRVVASAAKANPISLDNRTITVLEEDRLKAKSQFLSQQRQLKAAVLIEEYYDLTLISEDGDPPDPNFTPNTPQNSPQNTAEPDAYDIPCPTYSQDGLERMAAVREQNEAGYINIYKRVKSEDDFLGTIFGI